MRCCQHQTDSLPLGTLLLWWYQPLCSLHWTIAILYWCDLVKTISSHSHTQVIICCESGPHLYLYACWLHIRRMYNMNLISLGVATRIPGVDGVNSIDVTQKTCFVRRNAISYNRYIVIIVLVLVHQDWSFTLIIGCRTLLAHVSQR